MDNRSANVTLLGHDRVSIFAKQQFELYFTGAEQKSLFGEVVLGTYEQLKQAYPAVQHEQLQKLAEPKFSDEFVIFKGLDKLFLVGASTRAILFAVYHYLEFEHGLKWAIPYTENEIGLSQNKYAFDIAYHFTPVMERRGIVVETIDDIRFMTGLVDWLAKNKINELFLTIYLYDKISLHIKEMLLDRGIELTLGGHSASFFMKQLEADRTADHPYTAKRQLDYTDASWQPAFINQVVNYCEGVPSLTRLSLWPEDIKHQSTSNFLHYYIAFTAKLREALYAKGLSIEVEHIAYNASLTWDMLELEDTVLTPDVHTLIAYWGRDYTTAFDNKLNESNYRGYRALEKWHAKTSELNNHLTVFEYYSDHFMLSPLFGMLGSRIDEDIKHYTALNITNITNLIVPARVEHYPYQWNQYFNSFIYARALWAEPLERGVDYYVNHMPTPLQPIFKQWLVDSERYIAILSKWNVPLFPHRAVDPDKVETVSESDKALLLEETQAIIDLTASYLSKPEIEHSPSFVAVLKHFHNYARNVHKQWEMK